MEPKGSLPHSHEPTVVPYPEPQRAVHIIIYKNHFNIIIQCAQFLTSRLSP